jgi:hypothetical protein
MPQVIAFIGPLLAAAAAGIGITTGIKSLTADTPKVNPLVPQAGGNTLNPAQLANAVRSAKGDVQAQTGGGVSPDYLSQLVTSQYGAQAGNPGVVGQQSSSVWGGTNSFGSTGSSGIPFGNSSSGGLSPTGLTGSPNTPGGFNISDWLQQLQQGAAA